MEQLDSKQQDKAVLADSVVVTSTNYSFAQGYIHNIRSHSLKCFHEAMSQVLHLLLLHQQETIVLAVEHLISTFSKESSYHQSTHFTL